MNSREGAADSAHQAQPAGLNLNRPAVPERVETSIPGHLNPSVTQVPVTPGITRDAYESETSYRADEPGAAGNADPGYFSRHDVDNALAASPAPDSTNRENQSFDNKIETGARQGADYLRRVSVAAMNPSKETMADIRAISPDLSLTGNIISATFNIPHSLKYRKGADWVCASSPSSSAVGLGPSIAIVTLSSCLRQTVFDEAWADDIVSCRN